MDGPPSSSTRGGTVRLRGRWPAASGRAERSRPRRSSTAPSRPSDWCQRRVIAGPLRQVDRLASDPLDLVDPQCGATTGSAREVRTGPAPAARCRRHRPRPRRPEELHGPVDVLGLGDRSEPGEDLRTPGPASSDARTPSSKTVARGPSPASNAASASAMVRRRIVRGLVDRRAPRGARSRSSSARSRDCPRTTRRAAARSSLDRQDSSGAVRGQGLVIRRTSGSSLTSAIRRWTARRRLTGARGDRRPYRATGE